ncbi:unnamed protein product, partial [Iphiclides podalirius]
MIKILLIFAIAMLAEVSLSTPRVGDDASTNNAASPDCPPEDECGWHCYLDTNPNSKNEDKSKRSGNDEMRESVLEDAWDLRQYGYPLWNYRLYNELSKILKT